MVNSLAWNVAALWGGFLGASGSLGLKSSSLPASPSSWSTEDAAQVAGLWMANGLLFASRAVASGSPATYHYTLWSWNGVAWTASSPTWSVAPAGVAWDGTNYYTAEDGSIFQDPANPPTFAAAAAVTLGSGDAAQGVYGDFANTTPRALVATKKSGIRWTDDFGSTWHTIAAPTVNSVTVSLLSVAGPIDGANGTKYLAGSDGYGYFVFDVAQAKFLARFPASTLTWYSDKVSLSAASIRRILVDDNGTTTTVFMGTHGAGLWRGTFTDATGALAAAWTHE
jgi:hypothetical protein